MKEIGDFKERETEREWRENENEKEREREIQGENGGRENCFEF